LRSRLEVSPGPIRKEPMRKRTTEGATAMGAFGKTSLRRSAKMGEAREERNPIRDPAHQVQRVVDGQRKLGGLMVEEPIGDL
jgi:hypothetical protein